MEPGITPGIHQRVLGKQFANLVASMEPGITPGIHSYQFLPRPDAGFDVLPRLKAEDSLQLQPR